MTDTLSFRDPGKQRDLELRMVPLDDLAVIKHQRKASKPHIKRLVTSIDRVGYVVPVVAIEQDDDATARYLIVDGQHRFLAAKEAGLKELPVIVVSDDVGRKMLNLNVEKDPNIREKSTVALSVYKELVEAEPKLIETDVEVLEAIDQIHYVTLGIAYKETGRLAGSSFEPILKRCDFALDLDLPEAWETRQERGAKVFEADGLVKSISEQVKEIADVSQFVSQQIVAYANPFKRRGTELEFDDAFEKVIEKLEQLDQDPESAVKRFFG